MNNLNKLLKSKKSMAVEDFFPLLFAAGLFVIAMVFFMAGSAAKENTTTKSIYNFNREITTNDLLLVYLNSEVKDCGYLSKEDIYGPYLEDKEKLKSSSLTYADLIILFMAGEPKGNIGVEYVNPFTVMGDKTDQLYKFFSKKGEPVFYAMIWATCTREYFTDKGGERVVIVKFPEDGGSIGSNSASYIATAGWSEAMLPLANGKTAKVLMGQKW